MANAGPLSETAAPGPYCPLDAQAHTGAESFVSRRPVVGTTYFYWYDVYSGAHIRNADGTDALTTHPPASAMADLSYKSAEWHYSQLRDIREAGIDFIMPVFWGVPGQYTSWSFVGLPPLVEAHNRMLAEAAADTGGTRPAPPKIGLFYDTSTLHWYVGSGTSLQPGEKIDLTTDAGREWFYVTIRDFFSMIPPDKWARIDGKPIVFLYSAGFAKAIDDKLFADTQRRFQKDFATRLFIVREESWPGQADASYRWGGALGLTIGDQVAGLGPGYDHSAVPGRQPLIVSRQRGAFYNRQWERLLRMKTARRPWIVHVETWNEWHEGTDIARSEEYGDHYIRATARYAQMFRAGTQLDPQGPFARAARVRWFGRQVEGLELLPSGNDGCWQTGNADGSIAVTSTPCPADNPAGYLYFRVDDGYMYDEMERSAELTVVFRDDGGCERFRVEYDGSDPQASVREGAFRPSREINVGSSGTWRTVKLILPQVRFIDRANNADFRLAVFGNQRRLTIREILLRKLPGVEIEASPAENAQPQPAAATQ
ncbi:MAG TPA: DUF5010 domain-containing protein [Phycisphaerae bacterium]|nr:DUF5010 domain-containing protein [Phycisphaerae bacterium]